MLNRTEGVHQFSVGVQQLSDWPTRAERHNLLQAKAERLCQKLLSIDMKTTTSLENYRPFFRGEETEFDEFDKQLIIVLHDTHIRVLQWIENFYVFERLCTIPRLTMCQMLRCDIAGIDDFHKRFSAYLKTINWLMEMNGISANP